MEDKEPPKTEEVVIQEPLITETVKKIQIVPNWKKVFLTWSFAFHALSVVLTFVDQLLPFFNLLQPVLSDNQYAIWMFILNGLGLLSRFIKQHKLWEYPPHKEEHENDSST